MNWADVTRTLKTGNLAPDRRLERSEAEWQKLLPPEVYRIARQHGTEPSFSSEMCSRIEPGVYACVCCGEILFDSSSKFDSGTGWPSFTAPVKDNRINYFLDSKFGMQRVEVQCSTCDAHLGHVFPDGPPPSGLRFCMNALALKKDSN